MRVGKLTPEGSRVVDGIGAIAQPSGDERADTQHELLQGGHSPTDARVCNLTLVDRDDHDEKADT